MADLKLGLQLGYWSSTPPAGFVALAQEAERLGFDSVWTAEAYGSDALTPLAWIGASTNRIRLGTGVCQLSARTREYIDIIRQVLRREQPVESAGPHYPLPYTGEGAWGLGKPLKSIVHPLRAD